MCLCGYIGSYFLLPLSAGFPHTDLVMIFSAHMASNIIFALGTFGVLKNFPETQVAKVSAMTWRGQMILKRL